ncbi:MAG: metallophosphoesterase, partial [Cyanobacteria bacterium]|nr:metallophosphoesterase [Cyanobacteriota bacterium]
MVRFLHTADWQIGKQFSNIEGDASAFLRNQRIETVKRIGQLATERDADAVLVAGDVFDGTAVRGETILKTFKAMGDSFGGKWLLLPGNH